MNASIPAPRAIDKITQAIASGEALPANAASVQRLVRLAESDGEAVRALTDTISQDVALVHRVLAVANSAFFGFPGSVDTLARAVMVLGFNAVRNLALNLTLLDHLQDSEQREVVQREMAQSLLACTLARRLAEKVAPREVESSELATLLKSLGRLIAAAFAHIEMQELQMEAARTGTSQATLAEPMLGASFDDLTEKIVGALELPEPMADMALSDQSTVPGQIALKAMELAEALLRAGLKLGDTQVGAGLDDLSETFELKKDSVVHLAGCSLEEFEETCRVLKIRALTHRPTAAAVHTASKTAAQKKIEAPKPELLATLKKQEANPAPEAAPGHALSPELAEAFTVAGIPTDVASSLDQLEAELDILIAKNTSLGTLLNCVVSGVHSAVNYRNVFFAGAHPGGVGYRVLCGKGKGEALARSKAHLPLGRGLSLFDAAVMRGVSLHLSDLRDTRISSRLPRWVDEEFPYAQATLLVPLMRDKHCIGIFYADRKLAEPPQLMHATKKIPELARKAVSVLR